MAENDWVMTGNRNFTAISTESVFQPQFSKSSTNKETLQRPEDCKHKREGVSQWYTGKTLEDKDKLLQ